MKPLMMMRTRGLQGNTFAKVSKLSMHVAKSVGTWWSVGGVVTILHAATYSRASKVLTEMLYGYGTPTVTHPDIVSSPNSDGYYEPFAVDEPIWKYARNANNQAINSDVAETQTFNVLVGETYVFSAHDVFDYTFSGVGISENFTGDTVGERKAIQLVPTSGGVLTLTVNSDG